MLKRRGEKRAAGAPARPAPVQLEIPGSRPPQWPARPARRASGDPVRARRRAARSWPAHLLRSSD